jgi:hypothetical protein
MFTLLVMFINDIIKPFVKKKQNYTFCEIKKCDFSNTPSHFKYQYYKKHKKIKVFFFNKRKFLFQKIKSIELNIKQIKLSLQFY